MITNYKKINRLIRGWLEIASDNMITQYVPVEVVWVLKKKRRFGSITRSASVVAPRDFELSKKALTL